LLGRAFCSMFASEGLHAGHRVVILGWPALALPRKTIKKEKKAEEMSIAWRYEQQGARSKVKGWDFAREVQPELAVLVERPEELAAGLGDPKGPVLRVILAADADPLRDAAAIRSAARNAIKTLRSWGGRFVLFVTSNSSVFSEQEFLALARLFDGVLRVTEFRSDVEKAPFGSFDGTLFLERRPGKGKAPETKNFLLRVGSRTGIELEPLSLGPESARLL